MKIVYGCNGEGRGHASRAAALWPLLREHMDMHVWCPESVNDFLHGKCKGIKTHLIPGIHFSMSEHSINYWQTFARNFPLIFQYQNIVDAMASEMIKQGVNGVISDFEPFTAAAAVKAGIPLINLNHPAIVRRYLSFLPDAVTARFVAAFMTPPAQKNLICSFYDGDVGPILREEIRSVLPSIGKHILVYTKKSSVGKVKQVLKNFPDQVFHVFPDSERDFVTSLASCKAVIAPAGHQLLSEALFLKKPVLALPQEGQYEQRLNAKMLKASGWGRSTSIGRLEKDLSRFLGDLPNFPYKADPFHTFMTDDHTQVTASRISQFFTEERAKQKLSTRVSCGYFSYIPTKIKQFKEYIA